MQSVQAQGGYTLDFDGTDDYVTIAHDVALNPANITVEAWFNPRDIGGQSIPPIVKKASTTQGYSLEISDANDELRFHVYTAGGWYNSPAYVVNDLDQWYHVAGTYDGTDIKLYVDGVHIGTTTIAGTISHSTNPLTIGYDPVNAGRYWDGKIDEIRIWSDIRTQAEIQANMHKELAGSEANLVAYYQMANGTGTSLTDNSSNSFTGTITNGPVWKTSGAHAGPRMALDFDGTNDYVFAPINAAATTSITLEGWFSFNSLANQQNLMNIHRTANMAIRLVPYKTSANQLALYVYDGTTVYTINSTFTISQTNVWHHLAFIYDAGTVSIYANGVLVGYETGQGSFSTDATNQLSIGSDLDGLGPSLHSNVKIDEVRIWSTARTEAEIRANKDRTLDGDETGLVAYYHFDQQPDAGNNTVYDYSSNGNDGTLTNMAPASDWVASEPFNTWIGSEDSDWNNADNWSRGAVPLTEDVSIFAWNAATNAPASANISSRNIYVDAGATLSHSGNLTLSGDYYNAGTFTTTGNVTFSGSAAQTIQGTGTSTFGTLTVNNAAGVTMEKSLSTTTGMTLTSGALSIGANTLTINGAISQTSGSLTGGSTSNIIIGGSGASTSLPSVDLNTLTLNRANGITLAGTITVEGALTLTSGIVDLNSRALTLGSAASISGTPGGGNNINATSGSLRKDYSGTGSFLFPVGDGTVYSPITLNFTSATFSSGYVTVGLTASKHPSNSSTTDYIRRYWTVNSSGITGFSCEVSAKYADSDTSGTESNFYGGKYSSGNWVSLGQVNTGSNLVTGTVTGFSDFTAGELTTFPVEWLNFTAKPEGSFVRLDWSTASELNSDYFAIERSADQTTWQTLGQVQAAGFSTETRNYRYEDQQPVTGTTWYRLRQIDLDGAFDFSSTVELYLGATEVAIYPNPVQDKLMIDIKTASAIKVILSDINGRIALETRISGQSPSLDLSELPAGIYVLRLTDEKGWSWKEQIVKE